MSATCHACKRELREGETAWASDWTVIGSDGARTETRYTCDDCEAAAYGMCTACGSIEVRLIKATGTRDFSHIGESDRYPTGYGCEVCR